MTPRLLAFDWFNTLGNVRDYCTRDELLSYADQIERNKTDWKPFELPERWAQMPVFDDVVEGMERLRKECVVVIFSNAPSPLAWQMVKHKGLRVDGVTPLEDFRVSKPSPGAYQQLAWLSSEVFDCDPHEIAVVTANETFGDLEGAKAAGMGSYLIRGEEFPTLHALADKLGAT